MLKSFLFLFSLVSLTLCSESVRLEYSKLYSDEIKNSEIKYYHLPLKRDSSSSVLGITIKSKLIKNSGKNLPIIIISSKKLPNNNKESQWICGKIGKEECKIPNEFFKDTNNQKVNIGIFCNECSYEFKINYEENEKINKDETSHSQNEFRKLIALPQLKMSLQQEEKAQRIGGHGIAALIILFIFVITVVIACYVMMQIFVNTKLINYPLKLGRVEG